MEHISNFAGALDKDSSDEFMLPTNYRHLENGDIMYNEGEAGGLLVNVKGNKILELEWDAAAPAVPPFTSLATNPYGTAIKIVGVAYIRKDIVLFYADDQSNENMIDLLKYEDDGTYKRISLIYRLELGIRHTDKVYTEVRYENEGNIKIYYGTKNVNDDVPIQLSMINVAPDIIDGEVQDAFLQASYTRYITLPAEGLGALGLNSPKVPIDSFEIITGNLKNGAYNYAYRYVNKGGSKTAWSPLSGIVYLTDSSMVQGNQELRGGKTSGSYDDTNSTQGFKFRVPETGDYTHFEVVRIYYSGISNTPECNIVKRERRVGSSVYLVDTNQETVLDSIDYSEFSIPLILQAPKTITSKDDILFTANTQEELFDIEFDARIYSFTTARHAALYDEADNIEVILNGSLGNWKATALALDKELDCINRTNNIDYDFDTFNNDYKYQSDGTTRGAEGGHVKVEFIDDLVPLTDSATTLFPNVSLDSFGWVEGKKKLFQKDEIYRFGLIFFDSFGRKTPVKWITDLRMPSYYEVLESGAHGDVETGTMLLTAKVKIPKFTVDTNGTEAEGLYFQIVYVKREYVDRTVLTEGFGTTPAHHPSIDWLEEMSGLFFVGYMSEGGSRIKVGGSGFRGLIGTGTPYYFGIESPEVMFNKNLKLSGKRADLIGYYKAETEPTNIWWECPIPTIHYYRGIYQYRHTYNIEYFKPDHTRSFDISEDALVESGSIGHIGAITLESEAARYDGVNSCYYIGDACTKHYIYLPSFVTPSLSSGYLNEYDIPLLNIRQSTTQYGGRGYNARVVNSYIPASDTAFHSSNITSVSTYYGDTFMNLFEYQRTQYPLTDRDDDPLNAPYYYKEAETIIKPTESSINLNFRNDDYCTFLSKGNETQLMSALQTREEGLGYKQEITLYDEDDFNIFVLYHTEAGTVSYSPLLLYNSVFSRLNDIEYFVALEEGYLKDEGFDTRVRYSDKKTNGEFYDSWLNFRALNFKDADTKYGAINYLATFNDNIFMWQDNAFAHALVNPRVQTQGQDGVNMIIGTGETLHDIDYISTDMGIQNTNEAIKSFSALYWLDNNNKKIYKYGNGLEFISDTKNFSSYLNNSIDEDTEFIGVYDLVRDKVFLTVRNSYGGVLDRDTFTVVSYTGITLILSGDTFRVEMQEGLSYSLTNENGDVGEYILTTISSLNLRFEYVTGDTFSPADKIDMTLYVKYKDSYTVLFDEPTSTFRSFESFIPSIYLRGDKEFYSSEDDAILYAHNEGNRGEFYGVTYPMIVDVVVNKFRNINKMYGGVTFVNSVFDSVRGMEDTLDYDGTENKTVTSVRLIADRIQTPYLDLYTKDGKIITELDGSLSTGNIDSTNYTNLIRTIRDTNGLRLIPYPHYLYNVRNTLNEFRASLPRIDSNLTDQNSRKITELIRGNQVTLRTVYDNSDNDMIKLKSIVTHFNTSIDV